MMTSSTDRIEKEITLKAPVSRVWQALSDAEKFGDWFGVALQGKKFTPGERTAGNMTIPGHEHKPFNVLVERVEPEHLLSMRWHPYATAPDVDYSQEPMTLIVFELKEVAEGTLLKVVESGFDSLPESRRAEAYPMHEGGWEAQLKSIAEYVTTS